MTPTIELGPETRKLLRELCLRVQTETEATPGPEPEAKPEEPEVKKHKSMKRILNEPPRTQAPREPSITSGDKEEQIAALERLREKAAAEAEAHAAERANIMRMRESGCGKPVTKPTNRFLHGHSGTAPGRSGPTPTVKLTKNDIPIDGDSVACPDTRRTQSISLCDVCPGMVTRIKDPTTKKRYIRCARVKVE